MRGSCLCGAVTFEVDGPLPAPIACHCTMCRKQTGHFLVATTVPRAALKIQQGAERIGWYRSSARVQRGFCTNCGSVLFWDPMLQDEISIAMGAFDEATAVSVALHIFVADKGDYYDILDDAPQNAQ